MSDSFVLVSPLLSYLCYNFRIINNDILYSINGTMDSNSLIYFALVAEEGSFQAAARKLKMPNSTLSRHINALETNLKTQLLHRTTRRVSLTEAGEKILPSCQRLAEEYRQVLDITQEISLQPRGTLRITAPITAGRIFLSEWLASFSTQYPEIVLDVNLSDEQEDMVAQRYDVAIRVGRLQDSSLISRPFASTKRILCASPEFLSQHKIASISDISSTPVIAFSRSNSMNYWKIQCDGKELDVPIKPKLLLNDMTALLEAASNSAGVVLTPAMVTNSYLKTGQLKHILPNCYGETAPFHIVYIKRENLPIKTQLLVKHILRCAELNQKIFEPLH
ncbi:MAG: LysR family transcriptional regulator [Gammaproteobacteria bacterium]|nr:LysR family transcriptional regulator [Gammaproteobacteria bacterium]